MGLRRSDLDLLDLERLACAPADGSLALDGFSSGVGHGGEWQTRRENQERETVLGGALTPRADIIAQSSPDQFSLCRAVGVAFLVIPRPCLSLSATTTNTKLTRFHTIRT